jgi:hypothetical protein
LAHLESRSVFFWSANLWPKSFSALILIFLLGMVRQEFRGSVKGAWDLSRTVFAGKFADFHANK